MNNGEIDIIVPDYNEEGVLDFLHNTNIFFFYRYPHGTNPQTAGIPQLVTATGRDLQEASLELDLATYQYYPALLQINIGWWVEQVCYDIGIKTSLRDVVQESIEKISKERELVNEAVEESKLDMETRGVIKFFHSLRYGKDKWLEGEDKKIAEDLIEKMKANYSVEN